MDPDVVSRSLSSFYGNNLSDGSQFLEKIIQVPIQLPLIQECHLRKILFKKHTQLFSEISDDFTKETEAITEQLSQLFSTVRQINRYANQLSFVLPIIYQEVNIGDLCILEAIKSINVRAYNRIYTSKSSLLREKDPVDYSLDKAKELNRIETDYQSALEYIVEDINVPFKGLVKTLLDNIFRIRINQNPLIRSLIDLRYLCTNTYFNVYFIQSVPEGVISQQVINSIFTGFDGLNDEELGIWLKKFIEEFDDGEMQRAIISIIRLEKDLEKRAKNTTRWIKLLSNSSIAQQYKKNSLSIGIDLCTFINSVLISDYLVTEINRDHKKYDYPLITQIVDSIMKCPSIDFAMAFNAVMSNYDYSKFLDQDKSYIIPLVSRFLELSYSEQIKYSKFVLVELFKRWYYFDQQAPSKYLLNLLNDPNFDAIYFVEHLIDVNDSKRNVQEVTDFIIFFNESIEAMFNNNNSNSEFNERKSIKYLKSNYTTVLMNNRQREIGV